VKDEEASSFPARQTMKFLYFFVVGNFCLPKSGSGFLINTGMRTKRNNVYCHGDGRSVSGMNAMQIQLHGLNPIYFVPGRCNRPPSSVPGPAAHFYMVLKSFNQ
jgi:hypothetical protein